MRHIGHEWREMDEKARKPYVLIVFLKKIDFHLLNVCFDIVDMLKSLKLIVDDLKWKWLNK